jgi:hypothetical protein
MTKRMPRSCSTEAWRIKGQFGVLGSNVRVNGRLLRTYLWLQIIAGWLLSAIFIAGVTGLIRND